MRKPDKAFILAAGKGTRLRPYTDCVPKPMVTVGGKSIISRALDKLEENGVKEVVVNLHHLGEVLEEHLKHRKSPHIVFSKETDLLETGGGTKKALHHFKNEPFYLLNGDALWSDEDGSRALDRLARAWNPDKMDILLLLQPVSGMTLTNGLGDYTLDRSGRAMRSLEKTGTHMFAGIRILHPRIFDGSPEGAFSFLTLMDKAQQKDRLYGISHDGEWHHISTPEELERVDKAYRDRGEV